MTVVKLAPVPTNGGDADWRPAAHQLGWAIWHARQLGYVVPAEIEVANKLLNGGSKVSLLAWFGDEPFVLIGGDVGDDEDADDQIALLELAGKQFKARRKRRKAAAAEAITEIARLTAQVGRHPQGGDDLSAPVSEAN